MAIGSVSVTINGASHTQVDAEVYSAAYNAEQNRFGSAVAYDLTLDEEALLTALRTQIRYGEFFLLFLSKEAIAHFGDISERLEQLFGVIRYAEAHAAGNADYWCFARRGDMSFVPREGVETRNGQSVGIEIHTSLFEQFGDDGLLFAPVTFAGKKLGTSSPKAHRLMKRLTPDVAEVVSNPGDEVTQEEYNVLIRPDMEAVVQDTLTVLDENFLTSDVVTSVLPTGWVFGKSAGAKGSTGTEGARLFLGHLLLGPSAMDYQALAEVIENNEGAEGGAEAPTITSPVVQADIQDKSGFVVETRFFTTQTGYLQGDIATGRGAMISAFRNSAAANLVWHDGFGLVVRPTLMLEDGVTPDPVDEGDNIFIQDNSGPRGGSGLVSGRFIIKPNTYYNVRLLYNEAMDNDATGAITLSVWIWEDGKTATSTPVLQTGTYLPTNRRYDLYTGTALDESSGVGVGCQSLDIGEYWAFDYPTVRNTSLDYAQMVLDLDMTGQHEKVDFLMTLRARGFSLGAASYGHTIYVWNFATSTWEMVQRRVYAEYRVNTVRFEIDLLPEYMSGNHVYFLLSANDPQESSVLPTAVSSRVELDYVYGRSMGTAKKIFGKTDFYFVQTPDLTTPTGDDVPAYRPSVRQELILANPTDINMLVPGSMYLDISGAELSLNGPIEEILGLTLMQEVPSPPEGFPQYQVLEELRPGEDFLYFWDNPILRGSMQERIAVVIDADLTGQPIKVNLRTHNRVQSVDSFFRTSGSRKLDADILARHKKSVFVNVYARYKGVVTGNLTEKLREWIFNFAGQELHVSDISRFLLDQGVTQILLFDGTNSATALTLEGRRIDDNGVVLTESSLVLLRRAATETFVPGTVKLISVA